MMRPAVRLFVTSCAAALLFGAAPSLAQVGTPALDRALVPIPAPRDVAYPGVITLDMDATDIDRRIVSVRQTIPVAGPGPLVLLYPQWIPGNHGPVGPVDDIADLQITAETTGGDYEKNIRQRGREERLRTEAGLPPSPTGEGGGNAQQQPQSGEDGPNPDRTDKERE